MLSIVFPERVNKMLVFKKKDAQIGIRIRVVGVTGRHDRPLHYLGWLSISRLPDLNRGHRGSCAVTSSGNLYYSRALYQSELRRDIASID